MNKNISFKMSLFIFMSLWLLNFKTMAQREVPYTLDDRDRAIRTEERVNSIEKRLDQIDKQFEEIRASMRWQFGLLISAMFILVGFILWNRRTAIRPLESRVKLIEQIQDENIRSILNNIK